uniref:SUMO-activating enzyme subunit n=1 Tax=Chrysotila carterae TaxID=13221 RepID=A0A7S4C239_CHRCT|mmetsp:Transcript_2684/g.5699  ORF Transcript_2684/g.5699 Transcript_2684/m.5699 type:complete len:635 (+) Transcript_2684:169-2073(+)
MARAAATAALTGCDLHGIKVLVVGAGGIGSELLKNLTLSGFEHVTVIDLDTIDYSNLNRQFLFRAMHVGRSKAEVACESVMDFPHDESLHINAQHGNIKEERFGFDFFKQFNIVLNALDNVDARRHVNRVCLATGVPLIESGTQGYIGQVRAIVKGKSKCFECDPPAPPKSYPVCTIRNHPDKPVHCIAWAKELLFKKIFGGEDTDLVDTTEAQDKQEEAVDASAAAEAPGDAAPASAPSALTRLEGESAASFARRVFNSVYAADVERLLSMDALWKERTPPTPLRLEAMALPDAESAKQEETKVWSVEQSAAVLLHTIETVLTQRSAEVGALSFDKDDADALDFVTAASNLRSAVFDIPRKSRWDVKEIAGNIVPAIATTNAIIAGFIVLEAFKLLRGALDECRYCVCNRLPSGKKRDTLLTASRLDAPSGDCYVCAGGASVLTVDCSRFTVTQLLEEVIKKHLSFSKPTVDYSTVDGRDDQLCEGIADEVDEHDAAKFARYLPLALDKLPVPVGSGTTLDVEDTSQSLRVQMQVLNSVLDEEAFPTGFHFVQGAKAAAALSSTAAEEETQPDGGAGAADVAEADDEVQIVDGDAAPGHVRKRPRLDDAAKGAALPSASAAAASQDDDCIQID